MPIVPHNPRLVPFLVALLVGCTIVPRVAAAQEQWTWVGSIDGTAMYMDTTTITRAGTLRKVWLKSLDPSPKLVISGKDSLEFDVVIGLNVFDCANHTHTVARVRYMLGDKVVSDVPATRDKPEALKPKSFFDAVYKDLCGHPR